MQCQVLAGVLGAVIFAAAAEAAVLCVKPDKRGDPSGALRVRVECKRGEVQLSPQELGLCCAPSTTTTSTTSSSSSTCPVYTSTTLGAPDCGGSGGFCAGFCPNARACVPGELGACGCTGELVPCGIVSAGGACGGECPEGGTCQYWPSPLPGECPGPPVCGCFPPP